MLRTRGSQIPFLLMTTPSGGTLYSVWCAKGRRVVGGTESQGNLWDWSTGWHWQQFLSFFPFFYSFLYYSTFVP